MDSKFTIRRNLRIGTAVMVGLLGEELLARREIPWTLWGGAALLAISAGVLGNGRYAPGPPAPQKMAGEWAWVILALGIGAFFRWYQLDRIPSGIFLDQGSWGWGAERILYDGWRPFYDRQLRPFYETARLAVWEIQSYYQLALWFWLFGPSKLSLFSFSNFISLLGSLLAYWAFRQWGIPRASCIALFFMVTMRWYLNFSRCAHPAYDAPFYLCGTLALWLYAHETGKPWAWLGCALCLSAEFYAYPSLLITPLLVAFWAVYEWRKRPLERSRLSRWYSLGFLLTALLSLPVWGHMIMAHSFGRREQEDWLFSSIHSAVVPAVARHIAAFILMWDRQGDGWPIHNWPYDRTLDPVTGFLLLIGLISAAGNWRHRPFFYCLSGLGIMALPGLLTAADAPASHVTGMVPFIAYLAAVAFSRLWDSLDLAGPFRRKAALAGAALLLGGMAWSNFDEYFYRQAQDPAVGSAFYPGETAVGERLEQSTEMEYYLSPKYFGNFDVEFLAYRRSADFRKLSFWNLPFEEAKTVPRDSLFVLDEGKTGFLQWLQKIYPGGQVETYEYFRGWPLVYFYRVPAGSPREGKGWGGLRGTYWFSDDRSGRPVMTRTDPLLNFTFRDDFGLADFKTLSAQWTGYVLAPQKGPYTFLALTTDEAAAWVDGRKVLGGPGTQQGTLNLSAGRHRILVDFRKSSGVDTALNFLWKTPESQGYRVVPFWQWTVPPKPSPKPAHSKENRAF